MHTFHVQEFFIIIVQYMVRPTIGDFTLYMYVYHHSYNNSEYKIIIIIVIVH